MTDPGKITNLPREKRAQGYTKDSPLGYYCSRCGRTVMVGRDTEACICARCLNILMELYRSGYWSGSVSSTVTGPESVRSEHSCPDCGGPLSARQRTCPDCSRKRAKINSRNYMRKRRKQKIDELANRNKMINDSMDRFNEPEDERF